MNKGKLIVIDGTDGSGKATQVALLKERLIKEGFSVESLDFPRYYDNFFGKFVGECLRGEHGNWAGLSPKIASVIYAADRFESKPLIEKWLADGRIVILDRFVSSNQIHQGGKIKDDAERQEFMQWLDTMEHDIFALPRPDLIMYLDLSVDLTQELLHSKQNQDAKKYLKGEGDQHENNTQHLMDARESGLHMIAENNNWIRIDCSRDGKILSRAEIHDLVHEKLQKFLSKK